MIFRANFKQLQDFLPFPVKNNPVTGEKQMEKPYRTAAHVQTIKFGVPLNEQ